MAKAYRPTSSNKRIPVEVESAERMPIATTSGFQGSIDAEVTTKMLQDLPTELMEDILMKAVFAELRDQNKVKCTWKQARSVISRLSKVCSRWREILTTVRFQLELQRQLGTFPLHLKVVAKHQVDSAVAVTTMNNEIFVLCHDETNATNHPAFVNVYDRNDLWRVKHVIQLESKPTDIAACGRMNCLFMVGDYGIYLCAIEKQSDYEYKFVCWKYLHLSTSTSTLAMSANERLVVTEIGPRCVIQEHMLKSRGSLPYFFRLPEDILSMGKAIQKSNGNFIFQSLQSDHIRRLVEIDAGRNIVQQRRLPLCDVPCYDIDMYDHIMMAGSLNSIRMLDDQFQEIEVFAPGDLWNQPSSLHYDQEANEWMLIDDGKCLTVVAFKQGKPTNDNTDFV